MSFPHLKLTYFQGAGRAEAIRLAFFIGGIPFIDERLSHEQFAERKATLPYGQLPVLEVDGEVLAQSHAMLRYAGRISGLYPTNDTLAALKIDEILAAMEELTDKMIPSFHEQDPAKKEEMRKVLATETMPRYLKLIEARLVKLRQMAYFKDTPLTILSLSVMGFVKMIKSGFLDHIPTTLVDEYPEYNAIYHKTEAHPKVQQWNEAQKSNIKPKLKLTYFPAAGRAEATRLTFYIGGVEFEDERLPGTEIKEKKSTFPFNQVPVLEINGEAMAQSYPILRYAGSLTNMYPAHDPLLALRVDELLAGIDELNNAWSPSFYVQDEAKKKEMREALSETTIPRYLKAFESRLTKWNGAYAVGDVVTIADVAVFVLVKGFRDGTMDYVSKSIADSYPRLVNVYEKVAAHPKVVEWYQKQK